MSRVHFLNVSPGDCTVIEHNSGRVSVVDVCSGYEDENRLLKVVMESAGNFRRADWPTNPIDYMQRIGVKYVHRFIGTHPDMDHLDGFDKLAETLAITNLWHTGVTREKPPFGRGSRFKEADWDRYERVRAGLEKTTSLELVAGAKFRYANQNVENETDIDGLHILAPSPSLVAQAGATGDMNDASYVVLYRSAGGKILFTGDAHDDTFDYVMEHYSRAISNCTVLIAPHHGRHSDRDHAFLDVVNPSLTLFGYAPSEHLAYQAWNDRGLRKITSNQAGDVVLECADNMINVYVENSHLIADVGGDVSIKNDLGYVWYGRFGTRAEAVAVAVAVA